MISTGIFDNNNFNFLNEYLGQFDVNTSKLDNDLNIFEFDTINLFLHGCCVLFAKALNEIFKYDVYMVNCSIGVHYFCMYKNLYIDVRGITNNEKIFFAEFNIFDKPNKEKIYNIDNLKEYDENITDIGIEYAKEIINKYKMYYEI